MSPFFYTKFIKIYPKTVVLISSKERRLKIKNKASFIIDHPVSKNFIYFQKKKEQLQFSDIRYFYSSKKYKTLQYFALFIIIKRKLVLHSHRIMEELDKESMHYFLDSQQFHEQLQNNSCGYNVLSHKDKRILF